MTNQTTLTTLEVILDALGLRQEDLANPADTEGIRIEFEQNFAVEMQENHHGHFRISARICKLGQSLVVQEQQLKKALDILNVLKDQTPAAASLAISKHDKCLRNVLEMPLGKEGVTSESILNQFNEFLNYSFAYKQTYIAFSKN